MVYQREPKRIPPVFGGGPVKKTDPNGFEPSPLPLMNTKVGATLETAQKKSTQFGVNTIGFAPAFGDASNRLALLCICAIGEGRLLQGKGANLFWGDPPKCWLP